MSEIAAQHIVDIIKEYMALPDKAVWIRDQNRKIPRNDGLYIIVGMVDSSAISNTTEIYGDNPVIEENSVQVMENIQVDILSRSNQAILRRTEVIAALGSNISRQKEEKKAIKIHRIPQSFVNASSAEGGSQLNRYSISFPVSICYKYTRELGSGDYYDTFAHRVDDKDTIDKTDGLIEFLIDENTEV